MKILITNTQGTIHGWKADNRPDMYRDTLGNIIWGRHDVAGIDITALFPIEYVKNFPQDEIRTLIAYDNPS